MSNVDLSRMAARAAARYRLLSPAARDRIARAWCDRVYYCVECDEECRGPGDRDQCSRYPREHDESGYMGTGTGYPEPIQRLARMIAED